MENKVSVAEFEKALVAGLSDHKLDVKHLSSTTKAIINFRDKNKIDYFDWRVKGRPGFDLTVIIRGIVNPEAFSLGHLNEINYTELRLFPRGIPPFERAADLHLEIELPVAQH